MKYYNFETMFISLATALGDYLHSSAIYFEISKAGQYYHFEILTDADGAAEINAFLDHNTIYCTGVTA
jgi:ADP-heptose:LPS heptosyltransferase